MAKYENLPSVQLELQDGNLQIQSQATGPTTLVIDLAKKGQDGFVYHAADPNAAVVEFGQGSPLIEQMQEVRFGGAQNIELYRIGGVSASIDDLVVGGTKIETVDKSDAEGLKYSVYFGQAPAVSKYGTVAGVNQKARFIVIKNDAGRIVYSNIPGAEIDEGKVNISGFEPADINELDEKEFAHVGNIQIGSPNEAVNMRDILARPDYDAAGKVKTSIDGYGNEYTKYLHPGAVYVREQLAIAVPDPLTIGTKQVNAMEVSKGGSNDGGLVTLTSGADVVSVSLVGDETDVQAAAKVATALASYGSGNKFDVSLNGNEIVVSHKEAAADALFVFSKAAAVAGKAEESTITVSGKATTTGAIVVEYQLAGETKPTSLSVAVTSNDSASAIATAVASAIDAVAGLGATAAAGIVTVKYDDDGVVPLIKSDSSAIQGTTTVAKRTVAKTGVDAIVAPAFDIVPSEVTAGVAGGVDNGGSAWDFNAAGVQIPVIDLTAQIKAVSGHPLSTANTAHSRSHGYRPARVSLVFVGDVDGKDYDTEIVGKTAMEIAEIQAARQEWVYDVNQAKSFVGEEFTYALAGSPVSLRDGGFATPEQFTTQKWDASLALSGLTNLTTRDADGFPTKSSAGQVIRTTDVELNADGAKYKLFVEYIYLVDQVAAKADFKESLLVGEVNNPGAIAIVTSGDKEAKGNAAYSSGDDSIGASWEKLYELVDDALDKLETTGATDLYVGPAILDAPNITDLSMVAWPNVEAKDNIMRFVAKSTDDEGQTAYEWSNARVHYVDINDEDRTTTDIDSAARTTLGEPIVAKQFHEVNFAHRIGQFCHAIAEDEGFILASVGTSLPKSGSAFNVNKWIGKSPVKDATGKVVANGTGLLGNKFMGSQAREVDAFGRVLKEAYPKGFFLTDSGYPDGLVLTDSNGAPVDVGKYLSVVMATATLPNFSGYGQSARVSNAAGIYSPMLSNTRVGDSTTNALVSGVALPFSVKKSKLDSLAGAGYVSFTSKTSGVVVTSGEIATSDYSDYQYVSTAIVVGSLARRIRDRLNPFLGKGLTDVTIAAANTAIEGVFQSAVENGEIVKYGFELIQLPTSRGVGRLALPITIVPAFELRKVDTTLKLAYDI